MNSDEIVNKPKTGYLKESPVDILVEIYGETSRKSVLKATCDLEFSKSCVRRDFKPSALEKFDVKIDRRSR